MCAAGIFIVQMPEDFGRRHSVREIEGHSCHGSVKLAWNEDFSAAFRIDELHQRPFASVFRNERSILGMMLSVVPFHRRRQEEYILPFDGAMVRAGFRRNRLCRKQKDFGILAGGSFEAAGFAADFGLNPIRRCRLEEPSAL